MGRSPLLVHRIGSNSRLQSRLISDLAKVPRRSVRRLRFEPLEDRRLLTTGTVTINEYGLPAPISGPLSSGVNGIAAAPDGTLWFTEQTQTVSGIPQPSKIGKITKDGVATEYFIKNNDGTTNTSSAFPGGIVVGPDGAVWFTEGRGQIVKFDPSATDVSKQFTNFPIPGGGSPTALTFVSDQGPLNWAIYFTDQRNNAIGKLALDGTITEYTIVPNLPQNTLRPFGITEGPDGNIWFTEQNANKIGRMTPSGVMTEFFLQHSSAQPEGIAIGPDGCLWFTEQNTQQIGRITPAGISSDGSVNIQEFTLFSGIVAPTGITLGPDHNLWFTEASGNRIGQLDPSTGAINEFDLPTAAQAPAGITAGADGNIWFTELHYTPDPINPINGAYNGHIGQAVLPVNTNPAVDVEITSDTPTAVKPGDPITFHLTVKNKDTQHPVSFTVYDPIPAGVGFSTGKGDFFQTDRGTADVTKGLGTVHIDNLETLGTAHITLRVTANGLGQIVNRAYAVSNSPDSVGSNNVVVTSVTVQPPSTSLVFGGLLVGDATGNPMSFDPAAGGTTGKFSWTLTRTGGDPATNLTATITLPPQVKADSVQPFNDLPGSFDFTDGQHITFHLHDLPLNGMDTVHFGFMAKPTGLGPITVTANVAANEQIIGASSKTITTYVQPPAVSLTFDGVVAGDVVNPPKPMTISSSKGAATTGNFIWQLTNTGGTTASGLHATILVPTTLKSIQNVTAFPAGDISYDDATHLITIALPDLAAGQFETFGFTAKPTAIGPVFVQASVGLNEPVAGGGSLASTVSSVVLSDLHNDLQNPDPNKSSSVQGTVIPNAHLVPIYYGPQWTAAEASDDVKSFPAQMHAAMQTIVNGPYMDFLSQYSTSKFQIGRGTIEVDHYQTDVDPCEANPGTPCTIEDTFSSGSQIKDVVKNEIEKTLNATGSLPDPTNTLYVLFTPPGAIVTKGLDGDDSTNKFYGYHDKLTYTYRYSSQGKDYKLKIPYYYMVMPYEAAPNAAVSKVTQFKGTTIVFSHELAETVTDPAVTNGWRDYNASGHPEIGDIEAWKKLQNEPEGKINAYGMLDGVAVQYEWANTYIYPGTNLAVIDQPVLPQDPASTSLKVAKIYTPFKGQQIIVVGNANGESAGFSFSGLVGSFQDTATIGTDPSVYSATIDWGDGSTSTGSIAYDPNLKQFLISGTHSFTAVAGSTATLLISVINNVNGDLASFAADVSLDQATTPPAQIQFEQSTIQAYRNGSNATVSVSRVGDTTLAATVDYRVSGGTAVDGTDYQAESGTLKFPPGATSASLQLPIYANPDAASDLTVNLVLSTPTGNAVLGAQTTTIVAIHPATDFSPPSAPQLVPPSDTGEINDAITSANGLITAPLTFQVNDARIRNGFLQLVELTDPDHPALLGEAVQAKNGSATIKLINGALADGTHKIAVINSLLAGAGPARASQATRVVIDSAAPTSKLTGPRFTKLTDLPVSWSGTDNLNGTGVANYDIWVSVDGGDWEPWLTETTLTSSTFPATVGHSYAFFSSTVDVAGNVEPTHAIADASVLVTAHPWHNTHTGRGLDVTDDGNIVAEDVLSVINYINSKGSGHLPDSVPTALPARFVDTDSDDNVTASDVIAIINYINALPRQSEAESPSISLSPPEPSANPSNSNQATTGLAAPPAQSNVESTANTSLADLVALLAADISSQQAKRRRV